jgi:hypothetical protein
MKELMIMAAAAIPEEKLLNDLEEAIREYKLVPSDDNKASVGMFCMMMTLKLRLGDSTEKAMDMINGIDDIDSKMRLFDMNNN